MACKHQILKRGSQVGPGKTPYSRQVTNNWADLSHLHYLARR